MVQNNKVLTVSYGTFSCTLEGFEDSFGTMKVIAEYFRDLAADDRYFGAEPPQPDAEVLARIAQREIARQVEASAGDGGVHLRAAAALPAAAPAAAPVPEAQPAEQPAEVRVEAAPAEGAETAPEAAAEPAPETEAAAPAAVVAEDAAEAKPAAPVAVDAEEVEAEAEEALIEDTPAAARPDIVPAADSIAAKLQRIRDVVARGTGEENDEYLEDEHADAFLQDSASDIAEALGEQTEAEEEDGSGDDEIGRVLDHLDLTGSVAGQDAAAEAEKAGETAEAAEGLFEDLEEDQDEEQDTGSSESENILGEPEAEAAEPAITRPARARIIRVKRQQAEEAIASGALEEIQEAETPAGAGDPEAEDEAEMLRELAAVEAELRGGNAPAAGHEDSFDDDFGDDLEDEFDEPAGDTADAPASDETEAARPARQARPEDSDRETDVSRLMAAADEKLDAPESASSRETYSRLRAAVAAAEADRAAGGTSGTGGAADAYRDDLASVVRPRRPEASQARRQRPDDAAARPAPLKLVAEQRIDSPEPAPAASGPVSPRRITSFRAEEAEFEGRGSEGGFAAYAEDSGAVELHELLEAAASYMSFVEGREQFSRPQLMNKVQQLGGTEFNREDGLRSFGLLLREGKIERTNSGRFTASGDIGFRPGERAAG